MFAFRKLECKYELMTVRKTEDRTLGESVRDSIYFSPTNMIRSFTVFSFLVVCTFGFRFNGYTEEDLLEKASREISVKLFEGVNCLVIVWEGLSPNWPAAIDTPIVRILVSPPLEASNCYPQLEHHLNQTYKYNCDSYIIKLSRPNCFLKSWKNISNNSVNRHNPKILALPSNETKSTYPADDICSTEESDITSFLVVADIIHFDLGKANVTLRLTTNNFYESPRTSDRISKLFLDNWNSMTGFENNNYYLLDKTKNMYGKTIRLATWNYPPYCMADPLEGTEVRLVLLFCALHNCTVQPITDSYMWGRITENGTANGAMGLVYKGKADIGASGFYLWYREHVYLDYSTAILGSRVVCLVRGPASAPPSRAPLLPFDLPLWSALLASVILAGLSLWAVTLFSVKYTRYKGVLSKGTHFLSWWDSGLRAIGLLVLQAPSSRLVGDSPSRHLFTWFEMLYLLLASCYCAGLSSYLTLPMFYPPIDTIPELIDSGMYWLADHDAWVYSLLDVPDPQIQILASRFKVDNHDALLKMALTGDYCVAVERLPAGHSPEEPHVSEKVITRSHMMKESLYGAPTMLVMQKGSPYTSNFNTLIHKVLDSGILLFWEGEVARKFLSSRKQLALEETRTGHTAKHVPTTLQLKHVQGAFILLGTGLILSTSQFIKEMLVKPKPSPELFIEFLM